MKSLFLIFGLFAATGPLFADASLPPDGENWPAIRQGLFGERVIRDNDEARLSVSLPARAADASTVPLAIRVHPLPGDAPLRKIYLVIDKNPSPVGAVFEFNNAARGVTLETRVRIEDYTWVRVIVETTDDSLYGMRKYIKAAGGCSAPAGKSLAERMAGVGQMKWRVDAPDQAGRPAMAQLLIRHPNNSGLAMDQLTRLYDPPYFVRNVTIWRGDAKIFTALVDFTLSENPAFRFSLPGSGEGDLRATVVDTDERVFESSTPFNARD